MPQVIVFIIFAVIILLSLLMILFNLVLLMVKEDKNGKLKSYLKRNVIVTGGFIIIMIVFTSLSQLFVKTPPILDSKGNVLKGSIAELEKVNLNGRSEWISIRGQNKDNPVLLFLAGGPGGSEMAAERRNLSELEKNFVVVNWDQPGSCKSYGAIDVKNLTVKTYTDDGYALTNYLCKKFKKDKIYLVGESWGSALGIFMAKEHPEKYYSFIGTGQMVDFKQTEIMDYEKAMEIAQSNKDVKLVKKLKNNGKPPYYGGGLSLKSMAYYDCLSKAMAQNPEIQNYGFSTLKDISSPEYGMIDKFSYLIALNDTFNSFYPKLYGIDLRKDYAKIDIPVYFFIGKLDLNAPISLTQDYYNCLKAPNKEIVWFEHSGHDPWINESSKFVSEVLRVTAQNN